MSKYDENLADIGGRLRSVIEEKGRSAVWLAKETEQSTSQIYNILKGKEYGITKILKILEVVPDVSLDWLIRGVGQRYSIASADQRIKDVSGQENAPGNALIDALIDSKKRTGYVIQRTPNTGIVQEPELTYNNKNGVYLEERVALMDERLQRISQQLIALTNKTT